MVTKIVRLSGSTWVGTRLYPTLRRVLNGSKNRAPIRFYIHRCQAGSKKDFKGFYLGFIRDQKLFRVYGLKRVLIRSYPALRRVLYVHNKVPAITRFGPCQTLIAVILEIPDRTTVDPFRHPERIAQFVNLFSRYDPFRSCQTLIPSIQEISDRTTVDPFRYPDCTLTKFVNLCPRWRPFRP